MPIVTELHQLLLVEPEGPVMQVDLILNLNSTLDRGGYRTISHNSINAACFIFLYKAIIRQYEICKENSSYTIHSSNSS